MVGWFRFIYKVVGWEYPEKADEKQIRLRHLLHEQIRKTKNIKHILKNKNKGQILEIEKNSPKKLIKKKNKHLKNIIK